MSSSEIRGLAGSRRSSLLKAGVLTASRTMSPPSADDLDHRQGQEELLRLSSNAVLTVAENSGHAVPLDEPQVAADAVRRPLDALKSSDRRL